MERCEHIELDDIRNELSSTEFSVEPVFPEEESGMPGYP
jgi:hypothetical protein